MTSVPPLQSKLSFYKCEVRNKQGSQRRGDLEKNSRLFPACPRPPHRHTALEVSTDLARIPEPA